MINGRKFWNNPSIIPNGSYIKPGIGSALYTMALWGELKRNLNIAESDLV